MDCFGANQADTAIRRIFQPEQCTRHIHVQTTLPNKWRYHGLLHNQVFRLLHHAHHVHWDAVHTDCCDLLCSLPECIHDTRECEKNQKIDATAVKADEVEVGETQNRTSSQSHCTCGRKSWEISLS